VVDKRRFRANIYLNLDHVGGFAANVYVGRELRVGQRLYSRCSNMRQ
jgi:hypothetical protein